MAALPVAHNFPMSSPGVFGALYAGSRIVMCPSPSAETAFTLIENERVTITGVVPPLALLWMQAAPTSGHDISSLEVLLVGGAKFTPEAASRVRVALGCTLQQVFGMAEGLVNYTRLDDPEDVIVNTQGRPISPDDEVLIVDDHGQPVAEGEPGLLLARGPYTIRGYHNDAAANARSFTEDGFYRTGDIVSRTPEGYLVVRGRAGDHINRAGEKSPPKRLRTIFSLIPASSMRRWSPSPIHIWVNAAALSSSRRAKSQRWRRSRLSCVVAVSPNSRCPIRSSSSKPSRRQLSARSAARCFASSFADNFSRQYRWRPEMGLPKIANYELPAFAEIPPHARNGVSIPIAPCCSSMTCRTTSSALSNRTLRP